MTKKSNFLNKLLSSSVLAMSITALDAAAAPAARKLLGSPAAQDGTNLDQNNLNANIPLEPGSSLVFDGGHTYNASGGTAIGAVQVKTNLNPVLKAMDKTAFSLGPVIKGPTDTGVLGLETTDGKEVTITLTGAPSNVTTYVSTPPLPGNNWAFNAPANDYSGLGPITLKNAADKLIIQSSTTLTNSINGAALGGGTIEVNANVVFNNDIGTDGKFDNIVIKGNTKLMDDKRIYSKLVKLQTNNIIFELYNNTSIQGDITGIDYGIVSVRGDTIIDGSIRPYHEDQSQKISRLRFDTANKLTVNSNTVATRQGIDFQADGTLILPADLGFELYQKPVITKSNPDGTGTGSIIINNASSDKIVHFFGKVGDVDDPGSSLKLLEVKGGAYIILDGDASIKKIDIGSQDVPLVLPTQTGRYLINNFEHEKNKGRLVIQTNDSSNVTLMKGSVISTADKPLKYVAFTDFYFGTFGFALEPGLTLEDGVNLYTDTDKTGGIRTTYPGQGKLVLNGTSTISGVVGADNPFGDIIVKGNGKTVTFKNDVNSLDNNITVSQNATVVFEEGVAAQNIWGEGDNEGIVEFKNKEALTAPDRAVGASMGSGGRRLDIVRLAGGDIAFTHPDFNTNNLQFVNADPSSNDPLTVTFGVVAPDTFRSTTISSNKVGRHNIIFGAGSQILDKTVGSPSNPMGDLKVTGDNSFVFSNKFFGSISTKNNKQGTIELKGLDSVAYKLGSKDEALKEVKLNNNLTVKEGIWADAISIGSGKKVIFEGVVSSSATSPSSGLTLENNAAANFKGAGAVLDSTIDGLSDSNGTVTFDDNIEINKNIGQNHKVLLIDFAGTAPDKIAKINADLSATNIKVRAQYFQIMKDVKLTGGTSFDSGSTVDMSNRNLTLSNGISTVGQNVNFITDLDKEYNIGKITVSSPQASLGFAGAATIKLQINDNAKLPTEPEYYDLFSLKGQAPVTGLTGITIDNKNKFTKWSVKDNQLVRENNTQEVIAPIFGAANASSYSNSKTTGDAAAYVAELTQMDDKSREESARRLIELATIHVPHIGGDITKEVTTTVDNRMSFISNTGLGNSGVNSGDEDRFGVWVSPMYATAKQGALENNSGYKMESTGGTIGIDAKANPDLTLGIAGSFIKTNIKYSNEKSPDKTKLNTYVLSLYALGQLTDNWFMQGYASFGSSKVKITEVRRPLGNLQMAYSAFDTKSYSAELLTGYSIKLDSVVLTPMIGANYINVNDSSYKETGTTNQNLEVGKKTSNKVTAIAGLKAQASYFVNNMDIAPEVHSFARHNIYSRNSKLVVNHPGLVAPLNVKDTKVNKTYFDFGCSINTVTGMYEYGLGYDLTLAKKLVGHQGTLKIRVNF